MKLSHSSLKLARLPPEIKEMLPDIFVKDFQQTGNLANFNEPQLHYISEFSENMLFPLLLWPTFTKSLEWYLVY